MVTPRSSLRIVLFTLGAFVCSAQTDREDAAKLMASAQALASGKSPEQLHNASAQFESAAGLWRKTGDIGKQIEALYGAAWTHYPLGEYTEMSAFLNSAMDLAGTAQLPAARAELLSSFAVLHNQQGEHRKAIAEYAEARGIHESLKNATAAAQVTDFEATSWRMLGAAAEKSHDTEAAVDAHRQAADLYQQAGDSARAGQEYLHLGQLNNAISTSAAWEQSAGFYAKAIPLLEAAFDRPGLANAWWGLGSVTDSMNLHERSRDAFLKALPYLPDLQNQRAEGMVLRSLADQYRELGDLNQAIAYYERALPQFAAAHDVLNQYLAEMKLGKVHVALGENAKALAAYGAAAAVNRDGGNKSDEAVAEGTIGQLQLSARNWQAAIEAFTVARKLHAELGDKASESLDWGIIGAVYASRGQYREKLTASLRSLALLEEGSDRQTRTQALIDVGDCYNALHLSKPAIENLEKARAIADNDTQKASVLVELGEVYYGLSDLTKALDLENQALAFALKVDEPPFVNKIRTDIGLTRQAKGESIEARKIFEASLADARNRKDVQQIYTALHNLAKLDQDLGNNEQSVKLFEEALAMAQKDGVDAASTLDALGTGYHLMGQDEKAVATLLQALSKWRTLGNENGESISLNNLALVYNDTGHPQQAIDAMNDALSKQRDLKDDAGVAQLQRALGGIYQSLGDYDRAESYFDQALETQKSFGDEYGQSLTQNSLGVMKMSRQDPASALPHFEQALPFLRESGYRRALATVLSNIANVSLESGNFSDAEAKFNQSLSIAREIRDVDGQARALHGLGSVYQESGDPYRALGAYRQALALWRDLHDPVSESKTHSLIAKLERKQGKLEEALAEVHEAIRLMESQRGEIASEDLRAYFLASIAGPYKTQVDLLMDMQRAHPGEGWDARAFEASEEARARSLLDLINESHIDIRRGVDPALLAEDRLTQRSLAAKAAQLLKVEPDNADFRQLQLEVAELTAQRERTAAAIRGANPHYSSLTAPQPSTLRQIQTSVLDRQTMLLEYSLGEERSYLFAVTADALSTFELPRREEVKNALEVFTSDLRQMPLDRTKDPRGYQLNLTRMHRHAATLSAILLAPVASKLGEKRLIIVGDGELAQVPFGALPLPANSQPLILSNEILIQPSASMVAVLRAETANRKKPVREIAVIADPVFENTDPRMANASAVAGAAAKQAPSAVLSAAVRSVTRGAPTLTRLVHSGEEAHAVLALAPASRSIGMVGFDANKARIMDGQLAEYRIVHFATHGLIDFNHPQLSGLALSLYDRTGSPVDGFLDLNAIFDLKLQADLVVLSACETGEGKLVGGEGLMGLTRGFFYAGAQSLVVSLWNVDDEATGELMKRFYQGLLGRQRLRPAAALRAAQRSMILNSPWPDPYYWAAFTIQGEWR